MSRRLAERTPHGPVEAAPPRAAPNALAVRDLHKAFDGVGVLRGVDLQVVPGRLTAVLGSSGCGKTTLLRVLAGFESPDRGSVTIGQTQVCGPDRVLPPERRGIGYVSQEGALFPHLTVAGNITFGLPRKARRARRRVAELLELVGMEPGYARRYPHQLSGGQQQRVALARALAPDPSIVLLDEPFSALDAGLRAETRRAVTDALRLAGSTAVLVTHDQSEALSTADRVAVMRDGVLAQNDTPAELYTNPADPDVAEFVGDAVLLPARIRGAVAQSHLGPLPVRPDTPDGTAMLMIRPEQITIHCGHGDRPPQTNAVAARVTARHYYGHDATVHLQLGASGTVVTARTSGREIPEVDQQVWLTVHDEALTYPTA